MSRAGAIAVVVGWLCLSFAGRADCAAYRLADLGTLGGPESWALAINSQGAVVGCSTDKDGRQRAFLWTEDAGIVDLGTLGGDTSVATDINDAGEIAGYSDTAEGARHALLRTASGNMIDLGVPPGDVSSEAAAVEDLVVGSSRGADGSLSAFEWGIDTGVARMQPLIDGAEALALDISPSGTIVGSAKDSNGNMRAVVWLAEGMPTDLGTLGGTTAQAFGVNEAGMVVGESTNAEGRTRAFCWTPASGMSELVLLKGSSSARARAINGANRVVGTAIGDVPRAAFWDLGPDETRMARKITALPCPAGTTESEATAISGGGLIAGYCRTATGHRRAVIWRPVDDRSSIAIALVGGVFVPLSATTRDRFDDALARVSVKTFERVRATEPRFTGEVGYYRLNRAARARLIPITVGFERGFKPGRFCQMYLAVRGGPYLGKYEEAALGVSERKIGLNLNAAYGFIFSKSFYVELRYDYFSKLVGTDFSGVSVSAGIRLFDLKF